MSSLLCFVVRVLGLFTIVHLLCAIGGYYARKLDGHFLFREEVWFEGRIISAFWLVSGTVFLLAILTERRRAHEKADDTQWEL